MNINEAVADNVQKLMRKHGTRQVQLADAVGVSKQIMSRMLNGSRLISIAELQKIADYFHVSTDELLKVSDTSANTDVMRAFMGKVDSQEAREALATADELADMIIFHANVRENAAAMSETWEM